jgi:FlaA1/EpsC-like NDP-sugar epimerase
LTVTDPDMTRFLMTLDESVDLIEVALVNGRPGEIWIPKLPSMRIGDLAEIFSEISKKPMNVIGFRPGEKKHEDLVNVSEAIRTIEVEDHYVISHAMSKNCGEKEFTYSSNMNVMSKSELFVRLKSLGIIDAPLESFVGGKIEEIRTT